MRLCRFNGNKLGVVEADVVFDVTAAVLERLPPQQYPFPAHDLLIARFGELRPVIAEAARKAKPLPLAEVRLEAPVANPGKVVAAPVNYKKHLDEARADPAIHHQNQIAEIQKVGLFLKATSSIIGPRSAVAIRHPERRTDHEIELAAVIGKTADRVTRAEAMQHIVGYCIGLDMTIRGPEERSLRKSIDSFTVLGPWMVTADEISDPSALDLVLSVNGETRQKANTRDLVISIADLIVFASSFYTLHPGDILLTGTPEGVGPVQPGDRVRADISEVGGMDIRIEALAPRTT